MNDGTNEPEFADFLRRHRPQPPAAPSDEYGRLLRAARLEGVAEKVEARRASKKNRAAFALAAGVLVAVGLTLHFGGYGASPPNAGMDDTVEVFLDDTLGQALADPTGMDANEPTDYFETASETEDP
jgi:hypothetical protein